MKLGTFLASCDRLQRGRKFKIIASVVVVLLATASIGAYVVAATSSYKTAVELPENMPATVMDMDGNEITNPAVSIANQLNGVLTASQSPIDVAVLIAIGGGLALVVIWMGLSLSYLGLTLFAAVVSLPLIVWGNDWVSLIGKVLLGSVPLVMSFAALMQGLRMLFSFSHPVFAIARNVLAEALRMKISLLFIIMLVLLMATLPMMMDESQSLRYRVQSFLRYSTGISFWLIALLVVFFGAATVAFEQRDKIIWQTMTKPVRAWQYVLGKWLGVVSLGAVLLGVSATGGFLFTQYLSQQTAHGETSPYVTADELGISPDRLMLETQVLAARKSVLPMIPFGPNDERFDNELANEIELQRRLQGDEYNPAPWVRQGMRRRLFTDAIAEYLSIDPREEGYENFVFYGLGDARDSGVPITLRYKIDAEGNRPDMFYALTFIMEDGSTIVNERTGLGFSHTESISPSFINDRGELRISIINGSAEVLPDGRIRQRLNPNTVTFPNDGLEVSYVVGTFRGNYFRVIGVLWVKLALLAMLSICAATFSSFPVACLVSGSLFFIGESAGFVQDALPGWGTKGTRGEAAPFRAMIYHAADWISSSFTVYNDLRPTTRL
ncbi:MAG: ABC transporter permease, partial [Phycisphaerales bacterium]|nr:ABC transporter permease [Phycisphaerales bacterium]